MNTLPTRNYEIRTIQAGDDATQLVGGVGHGVEILDGGLYGRENFLTFGDENGDTVPSFSTDRGIRCVPGNRVAVSFRQLRLITPARALGVRDSVVVKILKTPHTLWCDVDPSGKPRRKWLTRSESSQQIAPGWTVLYNESTAAARSDRYWSGEEHEVATFWCGHVASDATFELWVFAATPAPLGTPYNAVQRWAARDMQTALPAGNPAGTVGAFVVDFTTGGSLMSAAGASTIAVVPSGALIIAINSPAGQSLDYVIGVRG